MSTLKSSAEDLTLNADGSGNDIIIQSNASTKAIVTAEGTVGIGTDSPSRLLTLYGDTGIALQNSTTGTGTGNGTHIWVNSAGSGELLIQNRENSDIEFLANDTVRMRILAAGGLCFGTDTAAANALDDYEEGTWTPTMVCSTSGSYVMDTGANVAAYTKVGRVVHIQGGVQVASESSPNGNLRMSLPFLPFTGTKDTNYCMGNATLSSHGGSLPNNVNMFIPGDGGDYASFYNIADDGTTSYVTHDEVDTVFGMVFSVTYIAA